MRRDMDLARAILLDLERVDKAGRIADIQIEGKTPYEIKYHVRLLAEAGLVRTLEDPPKAIRDRTPIALTWAGHEFVEASRDDGLWQKAKRSVSEKAGGLPFDVLKATLIKLVEKSVFGN